MKAIIENGKTYRVIEVRGSYVYADNKGKAKVFRADSVSIVEVEDIPIKTKTKTINKKKLAEKLYVTGPSREMTRQEREDVLDRMEKRKWESVSW